MVEAERSSCCSFALVLLAAVFAWPGHDGEAWAADQGWPRQKQQDGNTLVYYQPQLDSWKDQKVLKARMAVVLTLKGQKAAASRGRLAYRRYRYRS